MFWCAHCIHCCLLCIFFYCLDFCGPGKSRALSYNNTGGKHTCRNTKNTFVHLIFVFIGMLSFIFINRINNFQNRHTYDHFQSASTMTVAPHRQTVKMWCLFVWLLHYFGYFCCIFGWSAHVVRLCSVSAVLAWDESIFRKCLE